MTKAPAFSADWLREVLEYDQHTGMFYKKGREVGFLVPPKNYKKIFIGNRQFLAHRLAWFYVHGEWPASQIDHINGVKVDNRIENLRCVTPTQNMQNIRAAKSYNKTSGLLGVSRQKNKGKPWIAQISINGRQTYLGRFDTAEQAHEAYVQTKRIVHAGCTI